GTVTVSGTLELDGGIIGGNHTFMGAGKLNWNSGNISSISLGTETTTLATNFHMNIGSYGYKNMWGATVLNRGILTVQSEAGINGSSASLTNQGTLLLNGNLYLNGSYPGSPIDSAFWNAGTVLQPANTTNTLQCAWNGTNAAIVRADTNAMLKLAGRMDFVNGSSITGAGVVQNIGTIGGEGTVNVSGTLEVDGGILGGNHTFTGIGKLNWLSGSLSSLGLETETTTLATNFHMNLTGVGYKNIYSHTLNNQGIVSCSTEAGIDGNNDATVNNNGLMILQTNTSFTSWSTAALNNLASGVVRQLGDLSTVSWSFSNAGTLDIRRGNLVCNSSYTPTATARHQFTMEGYTPGTDYGQIQFNGPAGIPMDGKLSVLLTNGFAPTNGSSFVVLGYTAKSGNFNAYQYPPLTNHLGWRSELGDSALTLFVDIAPFFVSQPISQFANQATNVTFNIAVDGTGPIGIRWFFNDVEIPGVTGTSYTLNNVQTNNSGTYRIVLSNRLAQASSSNIVLKVVTDGLRPTLLINTPVDNSRTNLETITLDGKASDNVRVTEVFYKLNNGDFQSIALTNAGKVVNWSVDTALAVGTNTVVFKCIDMAGNVSLLTTRKIFYVVTNELTVEISGVGGVFTLTNTPVTNGTWLELTRGYTVKAVPQSGNLFTGWTGDLPGTNATLKFFMQPNLVIHANFVTNQCVVAAGIYNGLFFESNNIAHERAGFSTITLGTNGSFTGRLIFDGDTLSYAGQFNPFGAAHCSIVRMKLGKPDVSVDLLVDIVNSPDAITGTVGNGTWLSTLIMDRNVYTTNRFATDFSGNYTMLFPGGDGVTAPMGYGYGTMTIKTNGLLTFSGTLADNTKISQSVSISKDGHWPVYAQMYPAKSIVTNSAIIYTNSTFEGCFIGWVDLGTNPISGTLAWIDTSGTNLYSAGYTNITDIKASRYVAPTNKVQVLSQTNGIMTVTGGDLTNDLERIALLTTNNIFTIELPNTNQLKASIIPAFGSLQGSFVTTSNKVRTFTGVVLQQQNMAGGFFLGTNRTGKVEFNPAP
ncbi:MAG: hypothetical protein JWM68_3063, partial [Verrucomicrobiales bacterium]|nr:hypothetical protein [Verrucomicrobiales bacterium]